VHLQLEGVVNLGEGEGPLGVLDNGGVSAGILKDLPLGLVANGLLEFVERCFEGANASVGAEV